MYPKHREICRAWFKLGASYQYPVKLTKRKIRPLSGGNKNIFVAADRIKMKHQMAIKGNKKMAFKRQGQTLSRLHTGSSQLANKFELTFGAQPTRDHAFRRSTVSFYKIGVTLCSN